MSMYLGLDFGTTSTVISVMTADGEPQVLSLVPFSIPKKFQEDIDHVIPSAISFEPNGKVLIGAEVLASNKLRAENTFRWMKTYLMGTYLDRSRRLADKEINNEAAARRFLCEVLENARRTAGPISHICVTTPVMAFAQYQEWLAAVIRELGLPQPSFIDEPTAAAVFVAGSRRTNANVLVFDFGGGSLDITIVSKPTVRRGRLDIEKIKVQGSSGTILGGREIDAWLAQFFQQQLGLTTDSNSGISLNELLVNCEAAKEQLSFAGSVTVAGIDTSAGTIHQLTVSRAQLDELLRERGLFDRIRDAISAAQAQARENGVGPKDIGDVVLVGGSSLIPSVSAFIKEQFPASSVRSDRPFAAVALGAARVAAGHAVEARTFHEYAIRHYDHMNSEKFEVIVPAGQPIPSQRVWSMGVTATVAGQTLFNIEVYQRDVVNRRWHERVTDIIFGRDGKAIVGTATAQVPKFSHTLLQKEGVIAPASNHIGETCLIVHFDIDENRRLLLTVDDVRTNPTVRLFDRVPMVHLGS